MDVDPARCPLCGNTNACAMASGPACGDCWCTRVEIPRDVLARVPPDALRRACVCAACAGGARATSVRTADQEVGRVRD